ncbi:MAG: glutathione S-transferase [Oceanospirillaceae bacterium]|nr:glutathione S-transferase [Oceanospirillaceae bacterium]MCP5334866.1 glutathione S-transferase [Oceanospirillaceae bacterium]MCP5349537.1 glutathione S-transferase [Oceanospirillaceae bacterium]
MKLYLDLHSPLSRLVRLFILAHKPDLAIDVMPQLKNNLPIALTSVDPVGVLPVLVLGTGEAVNGSFLICDVLAENMGLNDHNPKSERGLLSKIQALLHSFERWQDENSREIADEQRLRSEQDRMERILTFMDLQQLPAARLKGLCSVALFAALASIRKHLPHIDFKRYAQLQSWFVALENLPAAVATRER